MHSALTTHKLLKICLRSEDLKFSPVTMTNTVILINDTNLMQRPRQKRCILCQTML